MAPTWAGPGLFISPLITFFSFAFASAPQVWQHFAERYNDCIFQQSAAKREVEVSDFGVLVKILMQPRTYTKLFLSPS